MFSVSLVGPDGVGKTTVAKQLERSFPLPIKYIYMGDNVESSNYQLPTTRWWKTRHGQSKAKTVNRPVPAAGDSQVAKQRREFYQQPHRLVLRMIRKAVGFGNRILEEWYRNFVASYFSSRGYIVVFDRHFLCDYYHFDIQPDNCQRSFKRKLHGFLLKHTVGEPDLVICMDAPGEVVFGRKGEFSADFLEARRSQYRTLQGVIKNFAIVDANRRLDAVISDVSQLILDFHDNGYQRA